MMTEKEFWLKVFLINIELGKGTLTAKKEADLALKYAKEFKRKYEAEASN